MEIRVFCILLFLIGVVDQKIEAAGVRVAVQNGEKLLLVELYELLHSLAKGFEEALGFIARPKRFPEDLFTSAEGRVDSLRRAMR